MANDETTDNDTPIEEQEIEEQEIECEAPPDPEEEKLKPTGLGVGPFPAVNVQLPKSGQGFYSFSANRNKQFGLAKTIKAIEAIGGAWFSTHSTGPLIGIGNISLNGGGFMSPHRSHQRGLDVDIRPLRHDGARVAVTFQDASYSQQRTQDLVNVIKANGILTVQFILFNDPGITGVQSAPGHDNHLHVRFR